VTNQSVPQPAYTNADRSAVCRARQAAQRRGEAFDREQFLVERRALAEDKARSRDVRARERSGS
jgi:hypothetical protein